MLEPNGYYSINVSEDEALPHGMQRPRRRHSSKHALPMNEDLTEDPLVSQ